MTLKIKKKLLLVAISLVWAAFSLLIILRNPYPVFRKKLPVPTHIGRSNDSLQILEYIYSKKIKK
jgi:hypothetical protein